ncbi:MAG: hypothetical protein PHX13_00940 [Thiovulaceae bacterium]|nr:hypothetical protein [Sulfurimonadaceae bacterium]
MKLDWTQIVLNSYSQSWFMWVGLIVFGVLILKFSDYISISNRDRRKKEKAGIGMISVGTAMHIFAIIAFITK